MSEFQRFQAEQERLRAKNEAAVAAQRKRDARRRQPVHVTWWDLLKAFLYIAGFGSLFAILFVRWLSGWHL